jgi:hypothetical protein
MKRDDDDRTVRELFDDLRREEAGASPEFSKVWQAAAGRREAGRGPSRLRPRRWILATACLAVVAIVVSVAYHRSRQQDVPDWTLPSLSSWEAPTDFLLETPGYDLLRTIPDLTPEPPGYARDTDSIPESEPPARRTES